MSDIVCRHEDAVAVVTLNRPQKYNALTAEMLDALLTTLQQLEQEPQVRAIVLPESLLRRGGYRHVGVGFRHHVVAQRF